MWWKTFGGAAARYFIARLPNWRQISGASPLGLTVATGRVVTGGVAAVAGCRERFFQSQLGSSDMTAKPSRLPVKRILLAEEHCKHAGLLDGGITFVGGNTRFEIWSKARFETNEAAENEVFKRISGNIGF